MTAGAHGATILCVFTVKIKDENLVLLGKSNCWKNGKDQEEVGELQLNVE